MAVPQDRQIDPLFWGLGGVTCCVVHHLPQNRQSQKGSCGPQTMRAMRAGFSYVVVSRMHLENSLNATVTWADRHRPSHKFHIVCT